MQSLGDRTHTLTANAKEGQPSFTCSEECRCLQGLAGGLQLNGAPGSWARTASSQVD